MYPFSKHENSMKLVRTCQTLACVVHSSILVNVVILLILEHGTRFGCFEDPCIGHLNMYETHYKFEYKLEIAPKN